MTSVKKCYYEVLGVVKPSHEDEIRKAYKKQAFKWHPDRNPDDIVVAEEKFKEVGEAYTCLSDKEKKAVYDRHGHKGFAPGHERTPSGRFDPGHFRNFSAFDFRSASDIFNNLFASGFFEDNDHFFGARFNSGQHRTSAYKPQRGFQGAFDVFGVFDRFGFDSHFDRMFSRGSRFSGMDYGHENDSADHYDRPVKSTYYKTEFKDGKKVVIETTTIRNPDGTSRVEVTQTISDRDGKDTVKKKFAQDSKGNHKEIPI